MTFARRLLRMALATASAVAATNNGTSFAQPIPSGVASPAATVGPTAGALASPRAGVRGCPDVASMKSYDGSNYVVIFQSREQITATIALRLYAGDHDYLVTLPNVTFPIENTFGSLFHQSQPVHLRKASGLKIFAASLYSTLQTPVSAVCDVKDIDVDPPDTRIPRGKLAPDSGLLAEAIDLTPADPTRFTCSSPFASAAVTVAVRPVYPQSVTAEGLVRIKVLLASDGSVKGASVYVSSGNAALDAAALDAARSSTYRAEVDDCRPVAGSYLFSAQFRR